MTFGGGRGSYFRNTQPRGEKENLLHGRKRMSKNMEIIVWEENRSLKGGGEKGFEVKDQISTGGWSGPKVHDRKPKINMSTTYRN